MIVYQHKQTDATKKDEVIHIHDNTITSTIPPSTV